MSGKFTNARQYRIAPGRQARHAESARLGIWFGSPLMSALGQKQTSRHPQPMSLYPPCVDGSELARTFFTFAALVGAAMCSAFQCGTQAAGHNALRGSGPNQ